MRTTEVDRVVECELGITMRNEDDQIPGRRITREKNFYSGVFWCSLLSCYRPFCGSPNTSRDLRFLRLYRRVIHSGAHCSRRALPIHITERLRGTRSVCSVIRGMCRRRLPNATSWYRNPAETSTRANDTKQTGGPSMRSIRAQSGVRNASLRSEFLDF